MIHALISQDGEARYLIRPEHIDISRHFFDAFGNTETEVSAHWLVRLAQKMGGWKSFTLQEIEELYAGSGHVNFSFNRLLGQRAIVLFKGRYYFTHAFISSCFRSAPALQGL